MAESPTNSPTIPAPAPKRRRHWLLKLFLGLLVLLVVLVLSLPTVLSTGMAQRRVQEQLSDALGTTVQIRNYSLGWFSGFELEGLVIQNPPEFSDERPAIALEKATGDLSIAALLRGRVSFAGSVEGLRVDVEQKADGRSNLQTLFQSDQIQPDRDPDRDRDPGPDRPIEGAKQGALDRIRLDARLVDAQVEIRHEQEGLVESLRKINALIAKEYDSSDLKFELSADLFDPKKPETPGVLKVAADIDATLEQPVKIDVDVTEFDFARYRPLLAAFLGRDQLTAFAGVLRGKTDIMVDVKQGKIDMGGDLRIAQPAFAGPLLSGLDVRAEQWVIQPKLQVDLKNDGGDLPRVDLGGFMVDLGFVRVDALGSSDAQELVANDAAVGLKFELDLGRIAAMGGPIPAEFAKLNGKSKGTIAVALTKQLQDTDKLFDTLRELVHVDTDLDVDRIEVAGFNAEAIRGSLKMIGGALDFNGEARIEQGPAKITAKTDLGKIDQNLPSELGLSWNGGQLGSSAVKLTRYVLPLLAGVDPEGAGVDFRAAADLSLSLSGPVLGYSTDQALQWLNQWSGNGDFKLSNGQFAPAAQFASLLTTIGAGTKALTFKDVAGKFKVATGFVETEALELAQEAAKIGLTGKTGFDGSLEYTIDLNQALRGRKDGEKILKALGGSVPTAKLVGSLAAPAFDVPDFASKLLEGAAKNAIDKQLKKGLDKILGDKKNPLNDALKGLGGALGGQKPGDGKSDSKDGKQKPSGNPLEDVLKKGLGDILGGQKKGDGKSGQKDGNQKSSGNPLEDALKKGLGDILGGKKK